LTWVFKPRILLKNDTAFTNMRALTKPGDRMTEKTLTRMDLSEAVFREVGLSRNESAQLVESVLLHVSDALASGDSVKISSFGTFSIRDKTARVGRNPKTGDEVPISPRRVLTFRPSHLMKDRVAAGGKG
jgi:integration host factor subunit alpha